MPSSTNTTISRGSTIPGIYGPVRNLQKWITISDRMKKIRSEYEKATGQKMQSTAQPIQEIVLVIDKDTTPEQVEKFCDLIRQLGTQDG